MKRSNISRRNFVHTSTIAASALLMGQSQKAVSANEKVRVGFIGVGGRGTTLLKNVLRVPDYQVVSICDLRQERVDRAVEIARVEGQEPNPYNDFELMLENEELDACICATEVANHAKVVIPVLEAGLHCFSEKPMESTVEKVDAIVKAARKAKGIYQIGFQRRYNPVFHTTIKAAQDDTLGGITFLQGHWYFPWPVRGWVLDVDMSGGKLVEQACHHLDVFSWVQKNQNPVVCHAMGTITVDHEKHYPHMAEDHSSLNYQFADGKILSYTHFSYMPEKFFAEKLWVMKDEGIVDLNKGLLYPNDAKENDPEEIRIAAETDFYEGTYDQFVSFARHIRNNETPNNNVETGRVSTLMAIMGHQAMYNRNQASYEPSQIRWEDLGSTTDKA